MNEYEPAYLEGLRLFNAGEYWEAHEALEAVWAPLPKGVPEKLFYQGLILLAAAFLHRERAAAGARASAAPAVRCYRSALQKFERLPDRFLGLDLALVRSAAAECFEPLSQGAAPELTPDAPRLIVLDDDLDPGNRSSGN